MRLAQAPGTIAEVLVAPRTILASADFALESALLIRLQERLGDSDNQPNFVHVRNSKGRSVLPGTSLAGGLRATRILNAFL